MSWLSTFVHNNRNLVNLLPGGIGTAVTGIFDPGGSGYVPPSRSMPMYPNPGPYNYNRLQNQGINPRTVQTKTDSGGSRITLPGGISAGVTHMTRTTQTAAAQGRVSGSAALCGITGYHLAKTPRLRDQGICVKNRHMNFGNGRAVKRAVRRLRGFHKLAVRVEKSLHIGRATARRRSSPSCSHR